MMVSSVVEKLPNYFTRIYQSSYAVGKHTIKKALACTYLLVPGNICSEKETVQYCIKIKYNEKETV